MTKIGRQAGLFSWLISTLSFFSAGSALALEGSEAGWRALPVKYFLDAAKTIRYCEFEGANHSKAFLLVVPFGNAACELIPAVNHANQPTSAVVGQKKALAGVNGGYFNLQGGLSASYVTVDGRQICDPRQNALLTENPRLKPYLGMIFNRSELRILRGDKGQLSARIQLHEEPVPEGWTLKHALQAGPRLLPKLTAREEAFLRSEADGTVTDSIGCLKTAARTACGITPDNYFLLLCICGPKQDEFSSGMTLPELAALLQKLGCREALNFDGGTSTTMVVKSEVDPGYVTVCGRQPETLVKSCLLLKKLP